MPDTALVGAEVTSLVVALVGVLGTLTATFASQRATLKVKKLESAERTLERAEERSEADRRAALDEKRAAYVTLNTSTRRLYTLIHDCLVDRHLGLAVDEAELEAARADFLAIRARAPMLLPDRALRVATEVFAGFGPAYRVAARRRLEVSDDAEAYRKFHAWVNGPLLESVTLLQDVLREDLGVVAHIGDIDAVCQRLAAERHAAYHDSGYVVARRPAQ